MSQDLNALVPELQGYAADLVEACRQASLQPIVTSTFRTYAEQKRLYEKFLQGRSQYPASPPGVGSHEQGWAFDLVVTPLSALRDVGALWESWGGAWGGRWSAPDVVHFELPGASQAARDLASAGQQPRHSGVSKALAAAADLIIGLIPGVGEIELAANLYSLGYPQSEIARFLGGPVEYFFGSPF